MKLSSLVSLAVTSAGIFSGARAYADDFEEGGKLYAIQNRKHVIAHEFAIGLGTVPLDAFYKGLTGNFSYTYHFDDLWGWEIVSGSYSLNFDTGLREDLETNFGVQPTEFPELRAFGSSNIVLKPMYGKIVLLNDTLIYGEVFLTAGPAIAEYKNAGVFIGANIGAGFRLFLSQYFALRFEVRDFEFIEASTFDDLRNELLLQFGVALNIGG